MGNVMEVIKLDNGRFAKDCPSCGVQQTYLRKWYAEASLREGKFCKSCSNRITENCHRGWHRGIRISWFRKFEIGANLRGIDFEITMDDVADIMDAQGGECALTGWCIDFPETGHPHKVDASIDRVDSQFGYIKGNIQLVHKMVNMCKQQYSQDEFVKMCKAVADKEKW
jgi:hypothetical protein